MGVTRGRNGAIRDERQRRRQMGGGGMRIKETGQPAGWMRGTKGDGRNERPRQMGGGGVRRGNATTSRMRGLEVGGVRRVAGVVSRHGRRLLDGEVRRLMVRDGATAPRWQGMARRLLDGEGRRDGSLMARDGARQLLNSEGRHERDSDGLRAQRRWEAMDSAMANGR